MTQIISTRGLVVRRISYTDTSQILTVFTKDAGILALLAKGAERLARPSSSFPAPLDVGGWYDLVIRFGGGEVHLATEGRLVEGFPGLRRSLPLFTEACFALELMPLFFLPGDPHPAFLRGALSYLKLLEAGTGTLALRIHYIALLLLEAGVAPDWQECVTCGEPAAGADSAPAVGSCGVRMPVGVLCGSCRTDGDERIGATTVRYLAAEASAPWGHVPRLDPGADALREAWRILRRLLLYHLERPPRSLRYLD